MAELYVAFRRAAWRGIVDEAYLDGLDVEEEGRELLTDFAPRHAGWRVLVDEEGGRVVGFVTFVADQESRTGHVGALFVSPDRFRFGIGTSLLDAAVTALGHGGCDEAILWTLEEDRGLTAFVPTAREGAGRRDANHRTSPVENSPSVAKGPFGTSINVAPNVGSVTKRQCSVVA